VVLFNHAETEFQVKTGDRVAQLILERIRLLDVQEVDELDSTDRGAGGFGSTGVALDSQKVAKVSESSDVKTAAQ
jgi:dUTPase